MTAEALSVKPRPVSVRSDPPAHVGMPLAGWPHATAATCGPVGLSMMCRNLVS